MVFLNHGSFGAVPAPVFEEYQRLQLEMERQPVAWLQRSADTLLAEARRRLAAYVGCNADDLVYVPNPTTAINMVAKSLVLEPGDEILTTVDHPEWQGTRDLSPFLATPAAIDWVTSQDWPTVQARCHARLRRALERIDDLTGLPSAYADDGFDWFAQLAVVRLPDLDPVVLKQRLYDEFRVETPVHRFRDQVLLRISIVTYNTDDDIDALVDALTVMLEDHR